MYKQGLMNLGNTCFINSTIQNLNNLKSFKETLIRNYSSTSGLVGKFSKLLQNLNSNNNTYYTELYLKEFINSFYSSNTLFRRNEQDDSHIFLVSLLNLMHKELLKYGQETIITQSFSNEIETITKDIHTGQQDEDSESCFCISLPIRNKYGQVFSSLEECLQEYQKPKQIIDSYTKKSYTEQTIIKKTGKFLVINLQRVSNGRHIRNLIKYPEYLPLNNTLYELTGLIKHIGDEFGGHKIALCKDSNSWFEFNDRSVTMINGQMPVESLVFLLFYQKVEDSTSNSSNFNEIKNDQINTNNFNTNVLEEYRQYEKQKYKNEDEINTFFKKLNKITNWTDETSFLNLCTSKTITKYEFNNLFKINDIPESFINEEGKLNYFDLIFSYKKFVGEISKNRSAKSHNKYKKFH
jgi:hypothetical protein